MVGIEQDKTLQIAQLIRDNVGSLDIIAGTSIATGRYDDTDCIRVNNYSEQLESADVLAENIQIWVQQHYPQADATNAPGHIRIKYLAREILDLIACQFGGAYEYNIVPVMDVDGKQIRTINITI
jgi:hypothetical protein